MSQTCGHCRRSAEQSCSKVYASVVCGHKICFLCLERVHKSKGPVGGPLRSLRCPICKTEAPVESWQDRDPDVINLENEKSVRRYVLAILNNGRESFKNTPLYDHYLEEREDTIYELAYGKNEEARKNIQKRLNEYKASHQKQIVENDQRRDSEEAELIKLIVEKEGSFYEAVKQPYLSRFGRSEAAICHPLKRKYAGLFVDGTNAAEPTAEESAGYVPQPLNEVDYEEQYKTALRSLARRKCSKVERKAGGWMEERVKRRVFEEFVVGFCAPPKSEQGRIRLA